MRNVRVALWALASVAALWSFSGVAMAEKRVALVVGNAAYDHAPKLANTGNDATDMAKALRELNFEVIMGRDLSHRSFLQKLKEFENATQGASVALFFYAGHASQYQGNSYLTPIDASELESRLDYQHHIKLDEAVMDNMRSGTRLVFLDACRNNPLEEQFRARSGYTGKWRGLVRADFLTGGSYIAFATQQGNLASDGKKRNSPFTAALLEHIRVPDKTIDDMMRKVRNRVMKETRGKQVPVSRDMLRETFYFSRSEVMTPNPLSVSSPPPSKPAGVYLRVVAGAGQKIEESHLEVVAKDRISAHEISGYSGVGGGCYSEGISAGTRLLWGHIARCPR